MAFPRRLLVALALVGCSSKDATTPPSGPAGPDCPEGFSSATRGFCTEIAPADECPGGTRPAIGKETCAPVGWTNCSDTYAPDKDGWGCTDLALQTACSAEKRETYEGDCVRIGDCSAAFPPAGAILVDDDFTPAQIDATHKKTIQEAVNAAAPGATIAIERGKYVEDVKVPKDLKIVGRCAEEVRIEPASTTDPGILTEPGAKYVEIRGVTVVGHVGGISVFNGANAKIDEVIIDSGKSFGIIVDQSTATIKKSKVMGTVVFDNRGGWGISAGGKSDVMIDEVNIVGGTSAVYAGTTDATISVLRTAVSEQAPQSPIRSAGMYSRGGRITVERSLLHDIVGDAAVGVEMPKGLVEVRNSVMRTIKVGGSLARGYGGIAFNGGELTVRDSAIIGAESVGLAARDSGSIVSAYGTVVRGPPKSSAVPDMGETLTSEGAGIGVQAVGKAQLSLDDCAVIEPWGWGAYADTGATLDLKHSRIHAVRPLAGERSTPFGFGLAVSGAAATVDDVAITKSTLTAVVAGKKGTITGKALYVRDVSTATVFGAGISAGEAGRIDLERSAVVDTTVIGVLATRGSDSTVRLVSSSVHAIRPASDGFGIGAVISNGSSVIFEGTAVYDAHAIGLVANGGRAHLVNAVFAKHPVALQAQGGSFIVESDDTAELAENEVRVSADSRFLENGSRVGVGEVPLPENVLK